MKIYVASSWRNTFQPTVVTRLRNDGHEVYDFRDHGFQWPDIDTDWLNWTPDQYVTALSHPAAESGFARDRNALDWCDACILVLPCGRSSHLELGYAAGRGKLTAILMPDSSVQVEAELMNKLADKVCLSLTEVCEWLAASEPSGLEAAANMTVATDWPCVRCGRMVEESRRGYTIPHCYGCLPQLPVFPLFIYK